MKRALAVLLVFGVAAFAQFPAFTGKWDATLCILPSTSLSSTLSLTTNISGIDITTAMGFGTSGLTSFKVSYKGALGPFSLKGNMWFDPSVPAYKASDLSTSMDFAGVSLGATVRHWVYPYWNPDNAWYPDTNPCPNQTAGDAGLQYIFTAKVDPFSIKLRLADCCQGTAFQDITITLKGIGLCCGIALDAELYFTKAGFKYLELTGIEIPLCCGVSLTTGIKFEVTGKSVTTGLKFAGIADACFTVYGDAVGDDPDNPTQWRGIEIWGYKIKCALGDCNYIEFIEALPGMQGKLNPKLPSADRFKTIVICTGGQDELNEFELIKLGFCGAGCCGGQYSVDLRIFFGQGGGLFGITRMGYSVKVPIMANFTLNLSGQVVGKTYNCLSNEFCLGWTFTF